MDWFDIGAQAGQDEDAAALYPPLNDMDAQEG
jgi:hypothetical protein